MNDQWWYVLGGQTRGPAATEDIRALVANGALGLDTAVMPVGGQSWATIGQYARDLGISGPAYAPMPPAPPPPVPPTPAPPLFAPPLAPAPASAPPFMAPPVYQQNQPAAYPPPVSTNIAGVPMVGGMQSSTPAKRLGALLLDGVLCYAIVLAAALLTRSIAGLVLAVFGVLVLELVYWSKGQSPAKAMLRMRCVNAQTGQPATLGTMFLREVVGKGILGGITFGITDIVSAFMILGATRQGIWDRLASTIVVDIPR
ncbi:MAG: RDD family protein [Mycobacterium sp.]